MPTLRPMTDDERADVMEWIRDLGYRWEDAGRLGCFAFLCTLTGMLAGAIIGVIVVVGLSLTGIELVHTTGRLGAQVGMAAGGLAVLTWLIHGITPGLREVLTRDFPQRAVWREKLKQGQVEERRFPISAAARINEDFTELADYIHSGYILQVGDNLLLSMTDIALGGGFTGESDTPFPGNEITLVYLPGEDRILSCSWSGEPIPLCRVKRLDPEKERSLQDFAFMKGRIEELEEILKIV